MCRLTWRIYCIAVGVTILSSGLDGPRFKISYLSIFGIPSFLILTNKFQKNKIGDMFAIL
jgi:hypothetical protein